MDGFFYPFIRLATNTTASLPVFPRFSYTSRMFCTVVPAVKLPKHAADAYTYAVPEALEPAVRRGSWVRVPWRGKTVDGIVTAVSDASDVPTTRVKPIDGALAVPPLAQDMLGTLEWMAKYYAVSAGLVLYALLPATPKRAEKKTVVREATEEHPSSAYVSQKVEGMPSVAAVEVASPSDKHMQAIARVREAFARSKDALVLVPHLACADAALAQLRNAFGDAALLLTGDMTPTAQWNVWHTLATADTPRVLVGTRVAVLAPLRNLGVAIVTECESMDHKQYDQNPRFDARTAARVRAALCGGSCIMMGHAPRAEDVAATGLPTPAALPETQEREKPMLVDIAASYDKAEDRLLSPRILKTISDALHSQKSVLVFHNRKGHGTALACRDCKKVIRCSTCGNPGGVHGDQIRCLRCTRAVPLPLLCPNCSSASLRTVGAGTAKIEQALAYHFPDAKVVRHDADTRESLANQHDADIVVGTQLLVHDAAELPWPHKPLGGVVATRVDDLLVSPGFRSTEEAWRTVRTLRHIADAANAPLVLQTVDGENPRVRALVAEPDAFYAAELADRKAFGYPPFATLVAVTTLGATEQESRAKAVRLAATLTEKFGSVSFASGGTEVRGPLKPGTPFRHGKWRTVVVLKATRLSPDVAAYLRTLPEDHLVDRDPEYLT